MPTMPPWFWYSRGGMLMVLSSTFSASLLVLSVVDGRTMVSACWSCVWFWITSFTESH